MNCSHTQISKWHIIKVAEHCRIYLLPFVLCVGYICQYFSEWQYTHTLYKAHQLQITPSECLSLTDLSWLDYFAQPSTIVRNTICTEFNQRKMMIPMFPNPVFVFVRYITLICVEPSRIVFDFIYTFILTVYVHLGICGALGVVAVIVALACIVIKSYTSRRKRLKKKDLCPYDVGFEFVDEVRNSCKINICDDSDTLNYLYYRKPYQLKS